MGLIGILAGLGLLIWLAFRGWSVLLLAPAAALVAAAAAREPLLAHWTQTFMGGAAGFLAKFFPLFLLGALFGKFMDDTRRAAVPTWGQARAVAASQMPGQPIRVRTTHLAGRRRLLPCPYRCPDRDADRLNLGARRYRVFR